MARYHSSNILSGGIGFGEAIVIRSAHILAENSNSNIIAGVVGDTIFSYCLQRLFEMILFPNTCEYGIAMDRIDACGQTFSTLISLDVQRYDR